MINRMHGLISRSIRVGTIREYKGFNQHSVMTSKPFSVLQGPSTFAAPARTPAGGVARQMIAALAALDEKIPQLGLYSSNEYDAPEGKPHPSWKIEWNLALRPALQKLGCSQFSSLGFERAYPWERGDRATFNHVSFNAPGSQRCFVKLIRTAKIKVRHYGSGYKVDRHVDHGERWGKLKMEKRLNELWRPDRFEAATDIRMVLFLGFDKALRPYHFELTQLKKAVNWETHGADLISECWMDKHQRDFNVVAACWTSAEE